MTHLAFVNEPSFKEINGFPSGTALHRFGKTKLGNLYFLLEVPNNIRPCYSYLAENLMGPLFAILSLARSFVFPFFNPSISLMMESFGFT